jgi:hypothetical protein
VTAQLGPSEGKIWWSSASSTSKLVGRVLYGEAIDEHGTIRVGIGETAQVLKVPANDPKPAKGKRVMAVVQAARGGEASSTVLTVVPF